MSDLDTIDHDRLFKELLTTFFLEFLDLFLPHVSAFVERDSLEFLEQEVFTDVTSGDKHVVDILARLTFRGQATCFLIHIENQSTWQSDFPRRMFRYFARLHDKYALPIYPVAVFSFDRPKERKPSTYQVQFSDFIPLRFRFRTIQLNRMNWRNYVRQPNPVASALMVKMNIAHRDRPKVKLECLRLLATLQLDPAKMQLISGFVDTYLKLNAAEEQVFQRDLAVISPPEREAAMQIVTSWMKEGIQIGEATVILRQLHKRFGAIPATFQEQVRILDPPQLEDFSEALLDFIDLADAEQWIADHA